MISLPGQMLRIQSTSFQFSDGVELRGDPARHRGEILRARQMAGDIAEVAALAAQDAGDPGGLGREIQHVLQAQQFRRHRHAVLDVGMALPDHLQVDGQHQRAALGRDRALDQRLAETAILHDVQLKPERLLDIFGDILDRVDRHRAQCVGNSGGLRGAAGVNFAVAELHAGRTDRRQDQRQVRLLADDGGGEIAVRNIHQNALAKLDLLQVLAIGAQRFLGVGAAIGVIEKCLGHLSHMNLAQILDAGDVLHERSRPFLHLWLSLFI